MPTTPATRDRLTAGLPQLPHAGRRLGVRTAEALYGDLPSSGPALVTLRERAVDQRLSDGRHDGRGHLRLATSRVAS